jgi:4-hydroxybenzoate polyprenyltransferase
LHHLLQFIRQRLPLYIALTRLNRPIGIYLLLWPTWWALWLAAEGAPDWRLLAIFTLGVVVMRSAGCAINDYADRHVDGHVARTKNRPLAAGLIRPREAVGVFVFLSLIGLVLVLQLNTTTILLSIVALILAATYPFGKRFHHLPQVQLGMAFGWAVPMAFAAQTGSVPAIAWLLFIANLFWTVAYDTLYAMADREDDLKVGVKSTAVLFGRFDLMVVSVLYVATLATLSLIGVLQGFGLLYFIALSLAAISAVWIVLSARDRNPAHCVRAFLRNNVFGALVLLAFVLVYLPR